MKSLIELNNNYDSIHDLLLISGNYNNEIQNYCNVYYLNYVRRNFFSILVDVRKIFKNYDAIMIHAAHPVSIFPLLFLKKQIYLFQHGMSVRRGFITKKLLKRLWFSALPLVLDAKTICSTDFALKKVRKLGVFIQKKRNIIVPFGIRMKNVKKRLRDMKSDNSITVGMANSLVPEKRNDIVLKSLYLYQGDIKINIKIAGDGRELSYLVELAKKIESKKVHIDFLGEISDMNSFYDELELFILPSKDESFGFVVFEALVRSIPVVVFQDVGGCLSIMENKKNGFVIREGIKGLKYIWKILNEEPEIIHRQSEFISKMNFIRFDISNTRMQLDNLVTSYMRN